MRAISAASRRRALPPTCCALLVPLVDPLKHTPPLVFAAAGLCLGDALGGQVGMIGLAVLVLAGVVAAPLFLLTEQPAGKRLALALIAVAFGTAAAHRVYRPDLPADHLALAAMRRRVLVEGVLNEDPE